MDGILYTTIGVLAVTAALGLSYVCGWFIFAMGFDAQVWKDKTHPFLLFGLCTFIGAVTLAFCLILGHLLHEVGEGIHREVRRL